MTQIVVIAAGGAIGTVLRFLLQKTVQESFPYGTLSVNIIGCFLIGCLWAATIKNLNEQARLFLMTGICGGFTTFSAFSLEALQMALTNRWMQFCIYVLASVAGGLLASFFGYKIFS